MKTVAMILMLFRTCVLAQTTPDGFAIPQKGRVFEFPKDHGSHEGFRTEWWYLTGHLDGADGRRFGFQVTFFRQAGRDAASGKVSHLHLAHAAMPAAASGRFWHEEKQPRGWDAFSSDKTLDVRNANWSLKLDEGTKRISVAATVKAEAVVKPELEAVKPLVVFGEEGVSRKGANESAARVLLELSLPSSLLLFADRKGFEIAISNILDNALKHTAPGGKIMIKAYKSNHKFRHHSIVISDTGDGITPTQLNYLQQVLLWKIKPEVGIKGLGLGMILIYNFARKNNINIHIMSEIGLGTSFELVWKS